MSGHKKATISLSLEEYQRLLDAEVKQRALVVQAPPPSPEIIEQSFQAIEDNTNWMVERQDQFVQLASQFDSEIQQIEQTVNQLLSDQQNGMMSQMRSMAGSLWAHTDQLLEQANANYEYKINQLQSNLLSQMAEVQQSLLDQSAQEDRKFNYANQWFTAAVDLLNLIDREYNHPFFMPGELDQIRGQLMLAEQNLQAGMPEACVSTTQQAYLGLQNARAFIEKEEMDWLILRQSVYEAIQSVYTEISQTSQIQAIDLDGAPVDHLIDVNYWSKGQWQDLLDTFHQVIEPVQNTAYPPSSDYLYQLVNHDLPMIRQQLAKTCFSAQVEALNSQLRANIADMVVQALSVQGFQVQDYEYESSDWRNTFTTQLVGLDKSSVTVEVVPSTGEIGQNELHIFTQNQPLRNQRELHQRWQEVEDTLELAGLTVGDYQVVGRNSKDGQQRQRFERSVVR